MSAATGSHASNVIKFAQTLLADEEGAAVTPALIHQKIDLILQMNPRWAVDLDRDAVIEELVRRFSVWIGQDTTLKDNTGHDPWLNAARKRDWRYWQRYREWMEGRLSDVATDGLDLATDHILGLLEDPERAGNWDRRGLVVGHVQSGKTGNYTGLICKAADAGYKIIIVLAGIHNNLRSQTQMRLDEGFLGYETSPLQDDFRLIGVGQIDSDPAIKPNSATNRSNSGDFSAAVAKNLGISPEERPWLFVVKKNKTVLERLNRWVRNHAANATDPETGRRIVTNLPLLLIDDEADHASVDTGEQAFDTDGNPDEEHQPKAINRLIRRLLHSFTRSAYVGYTATPFANIFIHERGHTEEEGPDLFPASFIINLGAPSNYVGPSKVFGSASRDAEGLPLVRAVDDFTSDDAHAWMPLGHKNGHRPLHEGKDTLPPSLVRAINSFFLATAVRDLRGQGNDHASMLVHVTRFTSVQEAVTMQIEQYVRESRQRLVRDVDSAKLISLLHEHWEREFEPTTRRIRQRYPDDVGAGDETWEAVLQKLREIIADIEVRMINGTAKDALDYADTGGVGLKVIAVGGDKLARGLTLEGLSTSYFLRASQMYDTLMQMGRWFGYRPGYLDLCRLYTTHELIDWFRHISEAAEELREEFDLMAASGGTPRDYGLKVQSHSTLMVTSRLKMRSARSLSLSFSGQLLETVVFHRDPRKLAANLDAGRRLLEGLGAPSPIPGRVRGSSRQDWTGSVWRDVPAPDIVHFLQSFSTHPGAYRVVSSVIADFVRIMAEAGELTSWTVGLIGAQNGRSTSLCRDVAAQMIRRTPKKEEDRFSIGRLMSPRDETMDLDDDAWEAALKLTRAAWAGDPARSATRAEPDTPNGPAVRQVTGFGAEGIAAHPERGMLLLYVIDPEEWEADLPPVLAFGISFPGSNSGPKIEYKVGNVYWEQVYGNAD